ncbi:MAG TPA: hypothetical protein GXX49_03610 [Clostridiaceae bacterium]|nr:hypothetical protein [Clostridiaceae bacterium]
MKSNIFKIILVLCVLLALCGCSQETGSFFDATEKTVESEDGRLSLKLPGNWEKSKIKLNPEARLEVSSQNDESHVFVIDESKKAFVESIKLEDYYEILIENFNNELYDCKVSEPTEIIVDGKKSILTEIKGSTGDSRVVYWLLAVDSGDSFTQVTGWTLESRYDQSKEEILDIVKSFRKKVKASSTAETGAKPKESGVMAVKSEDGKMELTVPKHWNSKDEELGKDADIAVTSRSEDKYVIAVYHEKEQLDDNITLLDYYNLVVGNVLKTMESYVVSEPMDTEVNGKKAILAGIKGTASKVEIAYWICAVESEKSFAHVSGWTLYSKVEENRDSVLQAMKSLVINE